MGAKSHPARRKQTGAVTGRLMEFGRFAARNRVAAGRRRPETFDLLGFHALLRQDQVEQGHGQAEDVKRLVRKLKAIRDEMQPRMYARGGPELGLGREEPVGTCSAEAHDHPRSKAQ